MRSRIYGICRACGMNPARLAEKAKITRRVLDKYEANGLEHAQLSTVARIAKALGCHIEDLFEEEDG